MALDPMPHRPCKAVHAPDWMVIDAVRYAFGRRTYQVGVTAGWVRANWLNLSDHAREIIQNDLEGEFATAERLGNFHHLGDTCDRTEWERVRQLWLIAPEQKASAIDETLVQE